MCLTCWVAWCVGGRPQGVRQQPCARAARRSPARAALCAKRPASSAPLCPDPSPPRARAQTARGPLPGVFAGKMGWAKGDPSLRLTDEAAHAVVDKLTRRLRLSSALEQV